VARKYPLTASRPIGDLNFTSLMDMTFLLLITFIITFPLVEHGIPMNLPRGLAEDLKPDQSLTIAVDAKGKLFLDDSPITVDQLRRRVNELGRKDPDATVRIRADAALRYEEVVKVLKILHDARIARMALITQADEEKKP